MKKLKTSNDKKRHGHHHKKSHRYTKVYLPYLPALLMIGIALLISGFKIPIPGGSTLAYATKISRTSLLSETNHERAKNNLNTLSIHPKLNIAAQSKANDMAQNNYWSHITPDNQAPWEFIDDAGYVYVKAGENLAYGFVDSESTVNGWMNSQSHRDNMLDSSYTEVGFGYANSPKYQNNGQQTIVVAMYARPPTPSLSNLTQSQNTNNVNPLSSDVLGSNQLPSYTISKIQSIIGANSDTLLFIIGIFSGAATTILLARHGLRLRKLLKDSENFVFHHPVLDITLLSFIFLCIVLTRSAGIIL
jgi:uncharacterized protein YkwD